MPRRRRSRASTSSEQSATSEELPDVVLWKTIGKDAKDKKKVSFSFALEPETKPVETGTVDLTEDPSPPPPIPPRPRTKTKAELKEMVDLTPDDNAQNPTKLQEPVADKKDDKQKGATKKQPPNKTDEAADREAKKKLKEEERLAKLEWEEINKMYKPGESLKHMQLEMNPWLHQQWYMEGVKRELSSLGVKVVSTTSVTEPTMVVWTRAEPRTLQNVDGQLKLSTVRQQCSRKLFIITAMDLYSQSMGGEGGMASGGAVGGRGEGRWTGGMPWGEGATVVLFGSEDLMKKGRTLCPPISKANFSKAIAELQIEWMLRYKSELVAIETGTDLGTMIARYTRAIADAPFKEAKREIDEQAEFYMRGDNKNCVTVDKDGNGLSRLWEQMIATLPMSSLEVARSLGAEYKSPRALALELQSSGGMTRIAELGVSRNNVPGGKTRKLGPEFARKLHTLFTCEDGSKLID